MKKMFFAVIAAFIFFGIIFGISSAAVDTDIVVSGYDVIVNNYVDETEIYYLNEFGQVISEDEVTDGSRAYIFVYTSNEVTINEYVCAPLDGVVEIVFELPVNIPEPVIETPEEPEPEPEPIPEPEPEPEIINIDPVIPEPYIEPEIVPVTPDEPEPEEPEVEPEVVIDEPKDTIIVPEVVDIPETEPEPEEVPEAEYEEPVEEEPEVFEFISEPEPEPVSASFTIIEEGSAGGSAKDGSGSFSTGGGNGGKVARPTTATAKEETVKTETKDIETVEVENELVEIPYTGSAENIAFAMFMMFIAAAGAIIFLEIMKISKKTSR